MIEITRREMDRAFRDHWKAFQLLTVKSYSGLACLFYAVECGLKSLIMRRQNKDTNVGTDKLGHNLNGMLECLRSDIRLPGSIALTPLKPSNRQRNAQQSELNQVWRYGVELKDSSDRERLTQKLEKVCHWIRDQR